MIGSRLKQRREQAGISQEDLGGRVGVAGQQVSRWEREENIPGSDKLKLMAQILATSADYLLGLSNEPSPSPEEMTEDEHQILALYRKRKKS